MQEERKSSMGSAIVDVFDAGVALAKAEVNSLAHKIGELAKAKGVGVVLLLAALVPLGLALIFLILAIYFGLVALGLPWWAAALAMFLGSLVIAGILVALALNKLSEGIGDEHRALTEDERLEAEYLAEKRRQRTEGGQPLTGAVVATGVPVSVGTQRTAPVYGQSHTTVVSSDPAVVYRSSAADHTVQADDMVRPPSEGAHAVPVYDSNPDGSAQYYGQSLNEKLDPHAPTGHNHGHADHDPNVVHPEVLQGAPQVRVSTQPTYSDDMNRGEEGGRR
ncbi:phage holin family protein [Deinococcus radiophilus]|uniref:Phage holin family protein n=1 Tax=Deinococcus radiophilus TaxID=32062 RepID=A0A3S0RFP1_9DEIO|nr:phage holin family protein [Deinococcus radiophilus]RTR27273.1 phage holin family protein [Deinococcus radiophilus]UFA50642.1 phage holin family protein [Deinococcus radiophilus]